MEIILVMFMCLSSTIATEAASFYGASYISVPLQDAKSTTDVQFKFRTRRSDAMLFLAAGRTDFCLVRLETGRLKVHINVGAGETEISSPKGLRLDDLSWHEVVISRREAAFTLQVDTIHVVHEQLPGRFFELNIHYGLFLGGQGEFSELFLGHLDTLRGCLSDVRYNGVNVLQRARERQGQVDVQGITWTCAPEFDASVDKHISFVEDGAFMAFPNGITRTGARWQFEVKTVSRRGVLLYNTGLKSRSDFVGVELVDGHLRLLLNKGNGALELRSQWAVSDGKWHEVVVQFNPTFMEISVDGASVSQRLPQGGSRYLDLAETVFVGGIELNKRSRALGQGLLTADTSFKGCLRGMAVEMRRIGIPDARVTQGILPDCVWEYPCSVQDPCVPGSQCLQQGVDSFRCECDQPLCVKPDYAESYKVFSKPTLVTDLEILVLTPLQVAEGDNALITTANIDVVLDYAKFGVRDSGVLLYVVEHPHHGKLSVDVWERSGARVMFTMLDLAKDKVRYLHDGTENHQDNVVLELELAPGTGFVLPSYLQGRHRFVLHVNITPINDPPSLALPPGAVLRLAQGTRKTLTPDVLRAEDPDSPSADLVYTVLSQSDGKEKGYVERTQNPGVRIDTFTQLDIDQGLISYVHRGGDPSTNTRLALQVSDGIETSPAAFLRVSAFPLQLRLVNNTGLILTHRAATYITPGNLTFTSNAEDPDLDIRYEIVKSPQFGTVQRLRGDSQWQPVDHFTSHQIAREQIRYLHTTGDPTHDNFKFKVSVMEVRSPTVYDFRITFTELRLALVHTHDLHLNGTREAVLTDKQLMYQTQPLPTESSKIVFQVVRPPRYGALHPSSSVKHHRLQSGDTFTQQDLDSARLRYRLHRKAYSHVHDDFTFRVTAPECSAVAGSIGLLHVPSGETKDEVRATLERLQVVEGGRQPVLRTHLDLATNGITELMYNVTHGPHHGRLDVMDVGLVTVLRKNTVYFSSRELMTERVFYVHDDSETRRDSFHFVALSSEEEDFQYVGVFHVDVLLKNDNTPVRAVDKVFQIVANGERLLTGRDLRYSDADIDTQATDIVYTRRGIPNGGIYQASDPTVPMFEFTQDDLDNFRVLFRHEGDEYGKVGLWITDGQFYANGVLEVRASTPFVQVSNNTGLVVQRGGMAVLSTTNLSAETNLNLWGEQIEFEVIEDPHHGHLQLERDAKHRNRFTQLDLENGHLSYHHDNGTAVNDHFRFRVDAGTTSAEGMFSLRIFPAWYWEPLVVANNRTLHVEESTSVAIAPSFLKIMHPHIPATDITYLVVEPPLYGYLEVLSNQLEVEEEVVDAEESRPAPVTLFDQSLIDDKRLHYIQAAANRTRDKFVVDVTNGITWLRGVTVQFLIVPEWLYISGGELRVKEGDAVILPDTMLTVLTEYYRSRVMEYRVTEPPRAGSLQSPREPGIPLHRFTAAQLKAGLIQYQHDGSETLGDQFVVRGIAGDKESVPAVVKVQVLPVNDEPPHIVNNTGLTLWEGATAVITPVQLAALDLDTRPDNLTFTVTSTKNGHVALVTAPSVPVRYFKQSQVNLRHVLFVHSGGDGGGFEMTVSDGVKTTGELSFTVTAHKVTLRLSAPQLHVFPMRRQVLTSSHLFAIASDPRRTVTFSVKSPPSLGRLMIESIPPGSPRSATNFTQRDLNNSRVFYEHTHPFFGLSTNDSFKFDVRADFAEPLLDQELHIDVSVSSGGLDQFVDTPILIVEEGGVGVVQLNTSGVVSFLEAHADLESTPAILMQVSVPPQHGELRVLGDGNSTSFNQQQLDAGDVTYHHDHSDTLHDSLHLSLLLEPGDVLLCNITIPIQVQPVNDEPFTLRTAAPVITVVQGQTVPITRENLLTEDPDTDPEGLIYDVINGPSQGRLIHRNGSTTVGKFTQADINAERILYQHSGPLQPAKFYIRVWDGNFNPTYTVFNIKVLPLTLNVTTGLPVMLQQGSSVALITSEHILAVTNAKREEVRYNVTRVPRHGMVYLHDVATRQFGQMDVDKKRVMYMQTDMTTSSDSLELAAWIPDSTAIVAGLELNVSVEPLIRLGNFTPIAGMKNKITVEVLDATPLAKLTSSNPSYQIPHRPRYGRLKKIIRSSGDRRNVREREVTHFTHEEVKSGVIYYVARRLPDAMAHEDGFPFMLAASIFQPAMGELRFIVRPDHEGEELSATPTISLPPMVVGPKDPVGHEGGFIVASPNMSSDYVLIVSMVLGVMLLAVLVIVVVKCRSLQVGRDESRTCKSELPPVPLPRPPDVLQPTSPHPKRFASNGSSPTPGNTPIPAPASVLQCKVIPLEPVDSVASSEPDLNARYPYGVSDEPAEDWSSYDTSELGYPPRTTNPMLRRNQYWV